MINFDAWLFSLFPDCQDMGKEFNKWNNSIFPLPRFRVSVRVFSSDDYRNYRRHPKHNITCFFLLSFNNVEKCCQRCLAKHLKLLQVFIWWSWNLRMTSQHFPLLYFCTYSLQFQLFLSSVLKLSSLNCICPPHKYTLIYSTSL